MDPKRAEINRGNAAKSTGPRSEAGKRSASCNAQKHGLSVPVASLQAVQDFLEGLADEIAGSSNPSVEARIASRHAANALFELTRIRRVKAELLDRIETGRRIPGPFEFSSGEEQLLVGILTGRTTAYRSRPEIMTAINKLRGPRSAEEPEWCSQARRFQEALPELHSLLRYEDRAFSALRRSMKRLHEVRLKSNTILAECCWVDG